jgi:hypothetical protein
MNKPKLELRPRPSSPEPAVVEHFVTFGAGHSNAQTSERPNASPGEEVPSLRGPGLVQRQSGAVRRRMTVYLPPTLAQSLQLSSVTEGRDLSDIVSDAVTQYLQRKQP